MAISTVRVPGEQELVEDARLDDAWALLGEFSSLVRESGTDAERRAVERITSRLASWGVPHTVYEPELLISLPRYASLVVGDRTYASKTPSMAASTPPEGTTASIVYLPTSFASSVHDIFSGAVLEGDVTGRFVITEGLPMPGKVSDLEARGALGVVSISPGERVHEGICTSIWGSPDLASLGRQPKIPVVSISNADGRDLIARIGDETVATMITRLETGWRRIPVTVAEIRGSVEPERFVLLHGHLDSWHVGIGDNATGDATLLEVARLLQDHRHKLARSVRICWWSGHSHGRYAGSTWFADAHANDIARNCVCHINCDSPGCRDATVFSDVYSMAEAEGFAGQAILDVTGLQADFRHPARAGDISFNNLGVSTFFMLSSTMPDQLRLQKGYHAVGGCGGNIEWHTEADTMEIADRDNLLRDMRLYAAATFRAANLPVHPLDFKATLTQIDGALRGYATVIGQLADLSGTFELIASTRRALEQLYDAADGLDSVEAARPVNDALLAIGRSLVAVLYSRAGKYRQDPALDISPLPDFAAAVAATNSVPDGVLRTELLRARNRLEGALLDVGDAAARVATRPSRA